MRDAYPPVFAPGLGAVPFVLPETAPIPGGRLELTDAGGRAAAIAIAPFLLGRTPVTNCEYAALVASGRAEAPPWWNDPAFSAPRQPVVGVSWEDAMAYCTFLTGVAGGRWRLPAEAEWELAACGGLLAPPTAWGNVLPPGEIPAGPLAGPWEVRLGTPNGYGLYDVGTIVHEWCLDWYETERTPRRRASRGGSWRHRVRWSAPSARNSLPPAYRYSDYGFRVLREL